MQWLGMEYGCPSPSLPTIRIVSCEGKIFRVSSDAAQYSDVLRIALERWTARCSDLSWDDDENSEDAEELRHDEEDESSEESNSDANTHSNNNIDSSSSSSSSSSSRIRGSLNHSSCLSSEERNSPGSSACGRDGRHTLAKTDEDDEDDAPDSEAEDETAERCCSHGDARIDWCDGQNELQGRGDASPVEAHGNMTHVSLHAASPMQEGDALHTNDNHADELGVQHNEPRCDDTACRDDDDDDDAHAISCSMAAHTLYKSEAKDGDALHTSVNRDENDSCHTSVHSDTVQVLGEKERTNSWARTTGDAQSTQENGVYRAGVHVHNEAVDTMHAVVESSAVPRTCDASDGAPFFSCCAMNRDDVNVNKSVAVHVDAAVDHVSGTLCRANEDKDSGHPASVRNINSGSDEREAIDATKQTRANTLQTEEDHRLLADANQVMSSRVSAMTDMPGREKDSRDICASTRSDAVNDTNTKECIAPSHGHHTDDDAHGKSSMETNACGLGRVDRNDDNNNHCCRDGDEHPVASSSRITTHRRSSPLGVRCENAARDVPSTPHETDAEVRVCSSFITEANSDQPLLSQPIRIQHGSNETDTDAMRNDAASVAEGSRGDGSASKDDACDGTFVMDEEVATIVVHGGSDSGGAGEDRCATVTLTHTMSNRNNYYYHNNNYNTDTSNNNGNDNVNSNASNVSVNNTETDNHTTNKTNTCYETRVNTHSYSTSRTNTNEESVHDSTNQLDTHNSPHAWNRARGSTSASDSVAAMSETGTLRCGHPRTPCLIEKDDTADGVGALYLLSRDGVEEVLYTADLQPKSESDSDEEEEEEEEEEESVNNGTSCEGSRSSIVIHDDAEEDEDEDEEEDEEEAGCFEFDYRCAHVTRTRITVDLQTHPNHISASAPSSHESVASSHGESRKRCCSNNNNSDSSSNINNHSSSGSSMSRGSATESKTVTSHEKDNHHEHVGCLYASTRTGDEDASDTCEAHSHRRGSASASAPSSHMSSVAVQLCLRYLNLCTRQSNSAISHAADTSARSSSHASMPSRENGLDQSASGHLHSSSSSSSNHRSRMFNDTFNTHQDSNIHDTNNSDNNCNKTNHMARTRKKDGLCCDVWSDSLNQATYAPTRPPSKLPVPLTAPLITLLAPWEVHFLYRTVLHSSISAAWAVQRVCPELCYRYPDADLRRAEVRAALRLPAPRRARVRALLELSSVAEKLQIVSLHELCTAWIADVMIRASYCTQSYEESADLVRECFGIADEWTAEEKEVLRIENEWPVDED